MTNTPSPHHENLQNDAAVEKIRKITKSARIAMLGTGLDDTPLHFYPMAVQDVDEVGCIWFLSARASEKNRHISANPCVQVIVSNPGDSQYLSVYGFATVSDNQELREKYWSALAKNWFPEGVNDPDLTVIQVEVESGHYWDTEHGKTVSFMLMAAGALTGRKASGAVEGVLEP